ncbi:MAG TPA: ABC transporter ATP-binding protein [Anaerolineae bacterium]|nr:ABC transporter ATP-binding protein [Anaerolineae bacterium]HQI86813.1 ABC transporter ATP-binding protein [Anaerolineae bacterium]
MEEVVTIQTKDLVKRFRTRQGDVTAIDGVTLQVRQGETYGLIGPDGAGKTTTTRVILGLLRRTAGESRILGFDSMRDTYAIRERVGYIAQQFSLPPDMTVIENMQFFANVQGVSPAEQKHRIPELLEFAGLSHFTKRLAGRLSGGMKKKLALACSLVHEPRVVMLDEPTLGVDPVSRREFWNLLGNLRAEKGLTIFVCTPYMDEAERCNWVGLIYQGRLVAHDSPQKIKTMVPGKLLEFTPSHFVPAQNLVSTMEGVLEVQTYGLMLHVFVDDVALRQRQIETAMAAQGIVCTGMRQIEARMEEAFISLIKRQQA